MGHVRCGECVLSVKRGCHRQLCHVRVPLGHVSQGGLVGGHISKMVASARARVNLRVRRARVEANLKKIVGQEVGC